MWRPPRCSSCWCRPARTTGGTACRRVLWGSLGPAGARALCLALHALRMSGALQAARVAPAAGRLPTHPPPRVPITAEPGRLAEERDLRPAAEPEPGPAQRAQRWRRAAAPQLRAAAAHRQPACRGAAAGLCLAGGACAQTLQQPQCAGGSRVPAAELLALPKAACDAAPISPSLPLRPACRALTWRAMPSTHRWRSSCHRFTVRLNVLACCVVAPVRVALLPLLPSFERRPGDHGWPAGLLRCRLELHLHRIPAPSSVPQ